MIGIKERLIAKYADLLDDQLRKGCVCCDLDGEISHKIRRMAEMGLTERFLLGFWAEVKSLSWPASYGQSPWETAGTLAYGLSLYSRNEPVGDFHGGYVSQFLAAHPAYKASVKLRGYSRETTAAHAVTPQDGAKVFVRVMPAWSRQDHARLAILHHGAAKFHEKKWSDVANHAAMAAFGRPYQITDYRISAIASEQFSDTEKTRLREHAHSASYHLALAAAHNCASRMRSVQSDAGGMCLDKITPPMWMRRLKENHYWSANALAGLSEMDVSPYSSDDITWHDHCDAISIHRHLDWLLKNEISVGPVAGQWDAIKIFEDEEEGSAPSMS